MTAAYRKKGGSKRSRRKMTNRRRYGGRGRSLLLSLAVTAVLTVAAAFFPELWEVPAGAPGDAESTLMNPESGTMPAYSGEPFIQVNGGIPFFTESDRTAVSFEQYSPLDSLGRCGTAFACVGRDLMPTEERGAIGDVRPSGWHTVKYDLVDGRYLYNRCHLIGYQLSGENANEENLITGTRYLNVEGMLPFENQVADYVRETGNHVLYRVTPVFTGTNLLADGVLMEALSVEDEGAGVQFCVFCYNVQPGIFIDYATGESRLLESRRVNNEIIYANALTNPIKILYTQMVR